MVAIPILRCSPVTSRTHRPWHAERGRGVDLEKRYFDIDGNKRNILQMIKMYPEWAANRLQIGEAAIETLAASRATESKGVDESGVVKIPWSCDCGLKGVLVVNGIVQFTKLDMHFEKLVAGSREEATESKMKDSKQ